MATTKRTLNILKRFSLSDLGDGWEDCYVMYRPMTVGDLTTFANMQTDNLTEAQSMQLVVDHLKSHVVSGKVSVLDEAGKPTLEYLVPDDIEMLPFEILETLFQAVSGASIDPKASQPAVTPNDAAPNESTPTPVSSSTA